MNLAIVDAAGSTHQTNYKDFDTNTIAISINLSVKTLSYACLYLTTPDMRGNGNVPSFTSSLAGFACMSVPRLFMMFQLVVVFC